MAPRASPARTPTAKGRARQGDAGRQGLRLLSVDFDAFFPTGETRKDEWQLWDWGGHDEDFPWYLSTSIWATRAATFTQANKPLPKTDGKEREFWPRVTFQPHAQLYFADTHALGAHEEVMQGVTEVVNYDAHHDCGYKPLKAYASRTRLRYDCGSWLLPYALVNKAKVRVIYPAWKPHAMTKEPDPVIPAERVVDPGGPIEGAFDRVFVCRSGAWVPPWVEDAFWEFLDACPLATRTDLQGIEPRTWGEAELAQVKAELGLRNAMRRMLRESRTGH